MLKLPISTVLAGVTVLVILWWAMDREVDDPGQEVTQVAADPPTFQAVCATCHGAKGEGNRELMSPSIASLPGWYIKEQIGKFRSGQRGAHQGDIHGQKMRAAVMALSDEQIDDAIRHIETLPALQHEPSLTGDPQNGAVLYREHCMACHRFNGHGELAFHSASLNGLQDWYLLEQINKFQRGVRAYHPDDESGAKMRQALGHITTEQDKLDILAQLTRLAREYPVVKNPRSKAE